MRFALILAVLLLFGVRISAQDAWTSNGPAIPKNQMSRSTRIAPDSSIWTLTVNYPADTGSPSYLFRSPDYGRTWKTYNFHDVFFYDISPVDSLTAYFAFRDSLVKTVDGGASWNRLESMTNRTIYLHFFNEMEGISFARDTARQDNYLTLWLTSDGGESWTVMGDSAWLEPPGTSLPSRLDSELYYGNMYSYSSKFDVCGDTILLGLQSGNVWISKDKGYNWERIYTPLYDRNYVVKSVAMKNAKTFAISGNSGSLTGTPLEPIVFSTLDGGNTWSDEKAALVTPATMEYLPGTEGTLIMTGHMKSGGFGGRGTSASVDFGRTWKIIDNGEFDLWSTDFINDSVGAGFGLSWAGDSIEGHIYTWNLNACKVWMTVTGDPCDVGLSELTIQDRVIIYPNPVSDRLYLSFGQEFGSNTTLVEIMSMEGRRISASRYHGTGNISLPVHNLPGGVYFLKITTDEHRTVKRFIRE